MIWGIIFLVIGLSLILKVIFKIDLPIFKVLFALFFIYLGFRILLGEKLSWKSTMTENSVVFAEGNFSGDSFLQKEYSAIFGKIKLDLSDVKLQEGENKLKVNAIFGEAIIYINDTLPYKVKTDVAFGGARLPEGSSGGFGSNYYKSDNYSEVENHLLLELNAVFGSIELRKRRK